MRRRKLPPPGGPIERRRRKLELEEHEPPPVDLISTLPDELLGEIISLLQIKDAARTQILASRWRRLWRSTPLNLDCCHLFSIKDEDMSYLCPSLVLSAHPGPGRRFCLTTNSSMTTPTLDHWLRSAALDNLQELEFARHGFTSPVPASISHFAHSLRVANIRHCTLQDAAVQGLHFPQLKQLGLECVHVSESSVHRLIAGCPALEFLLILSSSGFHSLRINSLSLRKLCIRTSGSTQPQFGELIIENAPRLESLIHLYKIWRIGDLSVYTAPKVDALDFLADLKGFRQGLLVFSTTEVVRNVRSLSVNMGRLILDNIVRLMRLFPSLEELHVKSGVSSESN
ncbi:hypothetical protein VPH35_093394 [Triticum aestivum]|uniref:F-box/FBD/LRR-repeat protein At1g13570-like n=1 Tax=Triticum aestivum TaxID=4565 RepID=UPI00084488DA|nr:F-box/FBD/LRR-repeat protein At1g13570-like [Triticum aestivum]